VKNMINRRGADGTARSLLVSATDGSMPPDAWSTCCLARQVGRAARGRVHQQVRRRARRRAHRPESSSRCGELLSKHGFDGDNTARHPRCGDQGRTKAKKGPLADEAILRLFRTRSTSHIELPGAPEGPAVPDADRGAVHTISGRGTVVTGLGRAWQSSRVGDEVRDRRPSATPGGTIVTSVETHRKVLDQGETGDNVGCLLRGIDREMVERGAGAGAGRARSRRTGSSRLRGLCVDPRTKAGRHKPFSGKLQPRQFYFRTTDVTGTVTLKDGSEMVMPGDSAELAIEADEAGSRSREEVRASPFARGDKDGSAAGIGHAHHRVTN